MNQHKTQKSWKAQRSTSVEDLDAISKDFVFDAEEEFLQPTEDCGVRVKANLPDGLMEGDSLDVLVCHVTSPSDFWIQLRRAENSLCLEKLMEEMDRFYSDEECGRLSKLDQCSSGAIMAAPYKEYGYHRVYIGKVLKDAVEVLYLDYGTTGFLQISQLRLLHRKFSELPAQALKAKLWRLTSLPRDSWSPQSIKRFFALVFPASNAGGCVSVVKEVRGGVLSLELYDTVTNDRPEGINISQQLIKEGMAVKEDGIRQSELRKSEKTGHGKRNIKPHPSSTGGEKLNSQDFESVEKTKDAVDEEKNKPFSNCKTTYISLLKLPNTVLHIINYKGQAWMTSFQISSLILNWKGHDLLDKMLELKRIPLEVEVVTAESDLYSRLLGVGMIPLKDRRTGEDKFLLYLVKCVPHILKTFIKDNQETSVAIQTALIQF